MCIRDSHRHPFLQRAGAIAAAVARAARPGLNPRLFPLLLARLVRGPRCRARVQLVQTQRLTCTRTRTSCGRPAWPCLLYTSYYDKSLDGTYKRDTAKARALLAEAGYGNGVDASMVVFQGLGIYTTMAQVVQANLKEVGINLKLEPVEWATLVERKNRGDYESMIYGVSVKLPDPDAYALSLIHISSWPMTSAS